MNPPAHLAFGLLSAAIQFAGAVVVVCHIIGALWSLLNGRASIEAARLRVLDGALSALSFTLAATLLRLVSVQTWDEIGLFAAIFVVRTGIKWALQSERALLMRNAKASALALAIDA